MGAGDYEGETVVSMLRWGMRNGGKRDVRDTKVPREDIKAQPGW